MANPYHDSYGRFCSKEEMVADMNRLAAAGDHKAYFELRESYDAILLSQGYDRDFLFEEELDNRPKLNMKNKENSLRSYQLVKDKIGGDLDSRYVPDLLSSKYLPQEVRDDIISRVSDWGIRDAIEYDSSRTDSLSPTDYQTIMKRDDIRQLMPLIAKNRRLSFASRKVLLENSDWGVSLLAVHDPERFFTDEELVGKLRRSVAEKGQDEDMALTSLTESPFEEDHLTIMSHPQNTVGYPPAVQRLARNPKLSLANSAALLRQEIQSNNGWDATVTDSVRARFSHQIREFSGDRFKQTKTSYNDLTMTPERKQQLQAEIAALKDQAESSFTSPEAIRAERPQGQIYANDADYKALTREHARLDKRVKKLSADECFHWRALERRIGQANRVRSSDYVLKVLEARLANG